MLNPSSGAAQINLWLGDGAMESMFFAIPASELRSEASDWVGRRSFACDHLEEMPVFGNAEADSIFFYLTECLQLKTLSHAVSDLFRGVKEHVGAARPGVAHAQKVPREPSAITKASHYGVPHPVEICGMAKRQAAARENQVGHRQSGISKLHDGCS
jgi:hypothetical protein